jgi:hypothetical protein
VAISAVVFTWQHQAPAAQQGAPVGGLIGDERSADPCALMDEEPLRRFGPTRLFTTYGNFNRCDVVVDIGAKKPVDVEVQLITRASRTVQGQPFEVVEGVLQSGECDLTVVVDDVYAVRVAAKLENPPLDLCAVARVATGTVLEVLRAGPIPRRTTPFPAGSLAHVDACSVLDDEALVALAAVDGDTAVNVFGNWACKWFSTVGGPGINLRYDQHPADQVVAGQLVDLGGHPGYVQVEAGSGTSCTVRFPHLPPNVPPRAQIDVVVLTVTGDRPGAEYCAPAMRLAEVATAKLAS